MSYALRHRPDEFGLTLAPGGWVEVAALIEAFSARGFPLSEAELVDIVRASDKQRFALSDDGTKIRANQGHSTKVDLGLKPCEPPEVLYHGTIRDFLESIFARGLERGERHHVHLSEERATAALVGSRRGRPVILLVDARAMAAAGHLFFRSANGVWLTEHVPPSFLRVE